MVNRDWVSRGWVKNGRELILERVGDTGLKFRRIEQLRFTALRVFVVDQLLGDGEGDLLLVGEGVAGRAIIFDRNVKCVVVNIGAKEYVVVRVFFGISFTKITRKLIQIRGQNSLGSAIDGTGGLFGLDFLLKAASRYRENDIFLIIALGLAFGVKGPNAGGV